jgi:uncharacterized damage-inducible protein DinB
MISRVLTIVVAGVLTAGVTLTSAQTRHEPDARPSAATSAADSCFTQERANFRLVVDGTIRRNIVSAAEAMPADKYGFAPTEGEFRNVRTFSQQVKHLAATNFILAAAALGQDPPADAGDETGPDGVVTKQQHIEYLRQSFDALDKAIDLIGDRRIPVRASPVSPFQGNTATRISLVSEAMTHSYDHYGQMVVYLRMNGVVPPASRR